LGICIGVYARQKLKEVLQGVESGIEKKERGLNTIMGSDFNARIGEMRAGLKLDGEGEEEEEERGRRKRKSKDKKMNRKSRLLVDFLEERGWGILNGSKKGGTKARGIYISLQKG